MGENYLTGEWRRILPSVDLLSALIKQGGDSPPYHWRTALYTNRS